MTKTYKHTVLWREAEIIDKEEDVYCFVDDDANEHNFYWRELLSLWFIEAPTDTEEKGDWIDKAYNDYKDSLIKPSDWYKQIFRKAIEKYMPQEQVGKELIPLDADFLSDYIKTASEVYKWEELKIHIKQVLSKYGHIQKQEDREDWTDEEIKQWMNNVRWWTEEAIKYGIKTIKWFLTFHWIHKGSFKKRSEMTLPTPTPQATSVDIEEVARDIRNSIFWEENYIEDDKDTISSIRNILSSLPIQKKRSKEYVRNSMKDLPCITSFMINQTYKFLEKEWLLSE